MVREQKNKGKERGKATKGLQQYYYEERLFHETFESKQQGHVEHYIEKWKHWDVPADDMVKFFMYLLVEYSDARQYDDSIVAAAKETGALSRWKQLNQPFVACFSLMTKPIEIYNCLESLKLDGARGKQDDE